MNLDHHVLKLRMQKIKKLLLYLSMMMMKLLKKLIPIFWLLYKILKDKMNID